MTDKEINNKNLKESQNEVEDSHIDDYLFQAIFEFQKTVDEAKADPSFEKSARDQAPQQSFANLWKDCSVEDDSN